MSTNKNKTDQPDLPHERSRAPKFKAKGISLFAKISSSFLICRIGIIAEI